MPQGFGGRTAGGGYGTQTEGAGDQDNRLLEFMPFVVAALIAAHLLAFQAYWIYRVAVEKQPRRRKVH